MRAAGGTAPATTTATATMWPGTAATTSAEAATDARDYDYDDDNAGHTTVLFQWDCGSTPLLPPLLPLLSVGGTVPLICAHP